MDYRSHGKSLPDRYSQSAKSLEFTGERVVPGLTEPDLWNEHLSRYQFASSFALGKSVLDVGCGTGYGTALLAQHARSAVGFDNSAEAIEYANDHFGKRARFFEGSASAFPAQDGSSDLVTIFEVIEHVEDWRALLSEAARVLTETGVCVISTPNTEYYAETRTQTGPNPFHVHEFNWEEFNRELANVFPYVTVVGQNVQEGIVFAGIEEEQGQLFVAAHSKASDSQFFIGICSKHHLTVPPFAYVGQAGNQLRERERHIDLLKTQVYEAQTEHLRLMEEHDRTELELASHNRWALSLEEQLEEAREKLAAEQASQLQLSNDFRAAIDHLEGENREKTNWAKQLNNELNAKLTEVVQLLEMLQAAEQELEERARWARAYEEQAQERTAWAQHLQAELEERTTWAKQLERELEERTAWAYRLEEELAERTAWAKRLDGDVRERTGWAQNLQAELEQRTDWARGLEDELEARTAWAKSLHEQLEERTHWSRSLEAQVEERTAWAQSIDRDLAERTAWAKSLEADVEERTSWARGLEAELEERTSWARRLEAELDERTAWAKSLEAELEERTALTKRLEAELDERTRQAVELEDQLQETHRRALDLEGHRQNFHASLEAARRQNESLRSQVSDRHLSDKTLREQFAIAAKIADILIAEREQVRKSKWLRLGRLLHLGPNIQEDPPV